MKSILIVDDEESVRSSLALLFKTQFSVTTAADGEDAIRQFQGERPDLVLLDITMPRKDGIETLQELHKLDQTVPIIMLSGGNTIRTAVQAMKIGAVDYLTKPFDVDELSSLIVSTLTTPIHTVGERTENTSKKSSIVQETRAKTTAQSTHRNGSQVVGESFLIRQLLEKVDQVAKHDSTVLITGESGVGKELIARRIHEQSNRAGGPFVPINCAAIPESLVESELFGHERGAFTSAMDERIGHFELAHGGTLFLDEIGELSLSVQVKMLRFLQEQEFLRVGSSVARRVNVRVVAATNQKLENLIKENKFRQDLYYRIHVVNLELPPLRDRYEDIPTLVQYFLKRFENTYGRSGLQFSDEVWTIFREYSWPGNIRELENVIESILALCPVDMVTAEHIPRKLLHNEFTESVPFRMLEKGLSFEEAERKFESDIITKALKKSGYVQTRAAELLGISRRILKYKMDKLGITEALENDKNSGSEITTDNGEKSNTEVVDLDTSDDTIQSADGATETEKLEDGPSGAVGE
ncbi:MAG: sigma-54-dependent transcriptional regulator [Bdellovibrionota bacterium]